MKNSSLFLFFSSKSGRCFSYIQVGNPIRKRRDSPKGKIRRVVGVKSKNRVEFNKKARLLYEFLFFLIKFYLYLSNRLNETCGCYVIKCISSRIMTRAARDYDRRSSRQDFSFKHLLHFICFIIIIIIIIIMLFDFIENYSTRG